MSSRLLTLASMLSLLLGGTTVSLWAASGAAYRSLWRESSTARHPAHSVYLFRNCIRIESSRGAKSAAAPHDRLLLPAWTRRFGVYGVESAGGFVLTCTSLLDGSTTYSYHATRRLSVHLATLTALLSVLPAAWVCSGLRRRRKGKGYCASCGYNLTANTSGVCPECGAPVPAGKNA